MKGEEKPTLKREPDLLSFLSFGAVLLAQFMIFAAIRSGIPAMWMLVGMLFALGAAILESVLFKRSAPRGLRLGNQAAAWLAITSLALWLGIPWMRVAQTVLFTAAVLAALAWFGWSFRGRTVRASQCARCGYETGLEGPSGEALVAAEAEMPDLCPECGADWRQPGGIVLERRERRWWMAAAAAAVLLTMFVAVFPGGGRILAPMMPTPVLIRHIGSVQYLTDDTWQTLEARRLSESQRLDLARVLLDRRGEVGFLPPGATAWLDALVPVLPDDLRRRYYMEMAELRFEVRSPRQLAIVREDYGHTPTRVAMFAVREITINGESVSPPKMFVFGHKWLPDQQPTIDIPGSRPLEVRARVWTIVGSPVWFQSLRGGPVTWTEEGKPELPPGAGWLEEGVIELKLPNGKQHLQMSESGCGIAAWARGEADGSVAAGRAGGDRGVARSGREGMVGGAFADQATAGASGESASGFSAAVIRPGVAAGLRSGDARSGVPGSR